MDGNFLKVFGFRSFERRVDPPDVRFVLLKFHILELCGLRKVNRRRNSMYVRDCEW